MAARRNVTWKVAREARYELKPRPYVADAPLAPEVKESLEAKLIPGNLFILRNTVEIDRNDRVKPSPHPYIHPGWYAERGYPISTLAIYAGTVRIEELKNGALFRALRHSFIIGECRYLVTNLNIFEPV